ncbi:MAG: allantoinase PuuE [Amaricoccus sp.]
MRYIRNMQGYGGEPPFADWPGGANVAVQFALNYEEGGENCILHGDEASEAFLSDIPNAQPWPGMRHWGMESIYEYGARAGFWRIRDMFVSRGVPLTIYGVATALARSPAQVKAMQEAGWEIASHGLKWINYAKVPREEEARHMQEAIRLHTEVTGEAPRGWYTGRCSDNTVELATEAGVFDWLADNMDDDLPSWFEHKGRQQLMVPYSLETNDMRFSAGTFLTGDDFFDYLKDSLDVLWDEGAAGSPKMMSVGMHCRLLGRPGKAAGLARFLDYVKAKGKVWVATRGEIAAHWRARHPAPAAGERPSAMEREAFVARFGGVYEHSPWVAERAWELELGPAHDTGVGVHSVLARAFRAASEKERLGVLTAHPDLAGKLAQAKRLTAESTSEQASAGLDALTDAERARFTELNDAYQGKFGFPFIIAVRDHDKAGILAAFEARVGNDRATELATAERQVERIAQLRLKDMVK